MAIKLPISGRNLVLVGSKMSYIIVSTLGNSTLYLHRVTKEKTIWSPIRSDARKYTKKELPRKLKRAKRWNHLWKTVAKEVT